MKEVARDSKEVMVMAMNKAVLKAKAQISVIDEHEKFTNIALQKITFTYKKEEYTVNHCWLQGCDYPKSFKNKAEKYAWYDIEFTFYPYRDKVTVNEAGRKMHGMAVSTIKKAK